MESWAPPQEFDDYVVLQPLGKGQMGHVYLAEDTMLARQVAIKFIASLQPDTEARQRFLIEARAAARVQHPNVVTIYRVGELDQQPYLITEFVRGRSLEQAEKPIPWSRVLEIAIDLSRGLAAAHRKGVLHCDIKSANVLVSDEGHAKLLDFGLATLLRMKSDEHAAGPTKTEETDSEIDVERLSASGSGPIAGTPDYMAPEIWRAEPASRRSDVYSLGAVLFELTTGHTPFHDVALPDLPRAAQDRDPPRLAGVAAGVDPRFAAIIDRCLARAAADRFGSGDDLREALEELARKANGASIPEGNPYRGLRPFEADHRALFFGRTAEIGVILDRLRSEPFVLVTGESGAGKSSICRAGILPAVADGALAGGRTWTTVSLVPGKRPLAALATALAEPLATAPEDLEARMLRDPAAFGQALRKRHKESLGLLIFVDQLEELMTVADTREAARVEAMLATVAAGIPGVKAVATVRADFLTRFASLPTLGEDVSRILYFLRGLSPERTREVIVGPAEATGTCFESDALVETLVASTVAAGGSLPLLQFALAKLWEARDPNRVITTGALEAMGGLAGALAGHADAVIHGMLPAERVAARRLLTRLVSLNDTRIRRTEAELVAGDAASRGALDALVRGRLLVAHDAEEGSAYELAHEVLITGWSTLRTWLREDAEGRIVRERLAQASAEWERLERAPDTLWGPLQLAELDALGRIEISAREASYVRESRRAIRNRKWKRRGLAVAIPVLAGSIWAAATVKHRQEVDTKVNALLAEANASLTQVRATAVDAAALRTQALRLFDAGDLASGEEAWIRALKTGHDVEQEFGVASGRLEKAVMLDGARADVKALLGEVLFDRALLAERAGKMEQKNELVERFNLYDETLKTRWNAPATLAISSLPPGALVSIERFIDRESQPTEIEKKGDLGPTPLAEVELAPGSYVLVFSAQGRRTVRFPILLERGEKVPVRVELPPEDAIPAGYVYVPPGRFLFGTAADEPTRRWFQTVPLHEVKTGGFIIGRTEVTFKEWFEFLDSLPPKDRAQRTPNAVAKVGFDASFRLQDLGNGRWELELHEGKITYRAASGEPIRYTFVDETGKTRVRSRNAVQDWLRFPVMGISADDAQAYAKWLSKSGRLRGARLCTDYEWERAARGADDRNFAHGSLLRAEDADFDTAYEPGLIGPDEVGLHPISDSPFGAADMTGNVFEWATSPTIPGQYVVRGGSYYHDIKTNHVPNRNVSVPELRDATLGVRLCASFPLGEPK